MIPPYLSIILPAHNEGQRLHACLTKLTDYLFGCTVWPFEILIIDNGSTDDTEVVGGNWSEAWPQVRYIRILERGKGLAVRTGMLEAVGRLRYMADVDLSTPATELQKFVSAIQKQNDIVIGVRPHQDTFLLRRAMSAGFGMLTRMLVPYQDTQCGFKMFTASAAEAVFGRSHVDGMAFDVEALLLARRLGLTVHELPVNWTASSSSRVRLVRDSWRMGADVVRLCLQTNSPQLVVPTETRRS
jgi:dolichyl-phosphate beta-glucosyltransferase